MTSPFPGMDPFLEGYVWPDVHQTLAHKIRQQLVPIIQPKYVAHLSVYVVKDDHPETEIGILYPDVEVLRQNSALRKEELLPPHEEEVATIDAPSTSVLFPPIEAHIPVVEIKNIENKKLVTAIEILSPVNKKSPGIDNYHKKRMKLHSSGAHLLEIDLLRRGRRVIQHSRSNDTDYIIALSRARSAKTDLWKVDLKNRLPIVPVPLLKPDPDVPLDLKKAFDETYNIQHTTKRGINTPLTILRKYRRRFCLKKKWNGLKQSWREMCNNQNENENENRRKGTVLKTNNPSKT